MKTHLWKINKEKLNRTNLAKYSDFIKKNHSVNFSNDFDKIWKWSVDNPEIFAGDVKDRFDEIITIPPLRERKEDIPSLIDYCIENNINLKIIQI